MKDLENTAESQARTHIILFPTDYHDKATTLPQTLHSPSSFPHTEEKPSRTRRPAQAYGGSKPDSGSTNKMALPRILKEPYSPKLNLIRTIFRKILE